MPDTRMSEETRARIAIAWPAILEQLAAGGLVRDALATHNISADMMRAWRASTPGVQSQWDAAREDSADAFMDEAMNTARNPIKVIKEEGKEPLIVRVDPAHARNLIDTLKWAARIRNPRLYSDKATLDVNVRTVDLTRIIQDANARLAAQRAVPLELKPGADGVYQLPAELAALM